MVLYFSTHIPVLNNDLNQQPEWIRDASGKIIGYKTLDGGADTVFPFNDASYSISNAFSAATTSSQTVSGSIPLKGIKHLKFNYSFTNYYQNGYVSLIASSGNKTIVSVSGGYNGANRSGIYDQDLEIDYDYLQYALTAGPTGWSGMSITNVVATA